MDATLLARFTVLDLQIWSICSIQMCPCLGPYLLLFSFTFRCLEESEKCFTERGAFQFVGP